jgi:hypothetical protein
LEFSPRIFAGNWKTALPSRIGEGGLKRKVILLRFPRQPVVCIFFARPLAFFAEAKKHPVM